MSVAVCGPRDRQKFAGRKIINTTSCSKDWGQFLSPFFLGPCELYDGHLAKCFENLWQYAKVYTCHIEDGEPTKEYWSWAKRGWALERAVRYPMGRGAKPEFSLWKNKKLDYVPARKRIYVPLYADAVMKTDAFRKLEKLKRSGEDFVLWDFDGYDYLGLNMTLEQVLDCPDRKMGHAFVLAMMLE